MTGIIVLAVLALAVIAALESSNRRNSTGFEHGPAGSWVAGDRDEARSKLDLLALGGMAEPFSHKPAGTRASVVSIRRARLFTHQHHGRHAA
ncbi:hypothetical protein F1D05_21375 [Kribbella qitaiheensis]|uniref:Uncharacterized protein n=1 Tax=Kribbella qitaiheensis TaxID=1544730 RepID=A0A7G6X180_9ACTN|nr:hypothetical protein [Kribbella qitaiheensis]QNE19995.1 hypothetical protein F1D05_21375 [Kribbella qitaiheensis]